jgi:hypothetical protein
VDWQSLSLVQEGSQSALPPQPSGIDPEETPWAAHVVGVQPQTFGVPPPPQVSGAAHDPQFNMSGQVPSLMRPQVAPAAAQVVGVQHTFDVPQTAGAVQLPQFKVPPQPSEIVPQVAPCAAHVVRVQHCPNVPVPGWVAGTHTPLQQL